MTRKPVAIHHEGTWKGHEILTRSDWSHRLTKKEMDDLDQALRSSTNLAMDQIGRDTFPLPVLGPSLNRIQQSLENGSGVTLIRGFPADQYTEAEAKRLFWGISCHIGTPVSQSAEGERLFSVCNAGYRSDDPRHRGPNSSKRLSFHSDRCDVIGFLCWRQARSGGENEIVNSIALHNEILQQRPDLLEQLYEPFYYKRHTVDLGNEKPWCQQPVFSVHEGHFACNILRVLIDRAYALPEIPDMTDLQREALDFVETTAGNPSLHFQFRQERGDILLMNNFSTLHRRSAFEDHEEPELRRHLFRIWLSVPNSRPLHPLFKDNYGSTGAGDLRGGMKAR